MSKYKNPLGFQPVADRDAVEDFYGPLAEGYDAMTRFSSRFEAAEDFFSELESSTDASFSTALDVATGTGVYALALAQLGKVVFGADISQSMIDSACRNADDLGLNVHWFTRPMQDLALELDTTFDLILCMGNSLPHLLEDDDLNSALNGFHRLLNPGGRLLIQLLNYDRILSRRERIVDITRHESKEYVRFYDFLQDYIRFNLLTIEWRTNDEADHVLQSVLLRPYRSRELSERLAFHGFSDIHCFSGLSMSPFSESESAVLLLMAAKE